MRHPAVLSVLVIAGAIAPACYQWKPAEVAPAKLLAGPNRPKEIELNTTDGVFRLQHPMLVDDSIVGYPLGISVFTDADRIAEPLSHVKSMQIRKLNGGKTTLAFVGGIAAILSVVSAVRNDPPPPPPPIAGGCQYGTSGCIASCPLVYSWTGSGWRLDSGTFGGALLRSLRRTDVDNLDFVVPDGRTLRLRVTNELDETDHLDALEVLAVDHAPGLDVVPDPAGGLHAFVPPAPPIAAQDLRGEDALARVRARDGWAWISNPTRRDSARTADIRDGLELRFLRPAGSGIGHLVLDGHNTQWATSLLEQWIAAHGAATRAWYDSLDGDPIAARQVFLPIAREGFLTASLRTARGFVPVGQYWEAGPEISKRQVLELDLRGVVGDTVVVRLESAPSFWEIDQVGMSFGADEPRTVHPVPLRNARTARGEDVTARLAAVDGAEYVLETGDRADLEFSVPESAPGLARTFLLRSSGWYRVHTPERGIPDIALLTRVATEPLALSRLSVGRLNDALAPLRSAAP